MGGFAFPRFTFDLWFRVGLVAAIAVAYAPSLRHPPRADQWCYLNDMASHHGVLDVIRSSYSYTRTRQTLPGDPDLYRPVLFTLLAAEKAVLEGDTRATQAIGIGLHCGVCLLLLSLLSRIETIARSGRQEELAAASSPSYLPYIATAFFALSPGILEMVIWAHLHGYILFLVFLLGSANLMLRHLSRPAGSGWLSPSLAGAWVLTLAAAFTYELGQFYAVLAGLFLAAATYNRTGFVRSAALLAAFIGVMLLYQAANRRDLHIHRHQFVPINIKEDIVREAVTRATLIHTTRYVIYTGVQPLCPSLSHAWMSGDRVNLGEMLWYDPILRKCGATEAASALVLGLFAWFGMTGLWALLWRRDRLSLLVVLLFLATGAVYAAMNILGRMNIRPGTCSLSSNSYYCYTALLLGLTTWVAAVQGVSRSRGPMKALAWNSLLAGLAGLAIYGGVQVRSLNTMLADLMKPMASPILAIHRFVQHHRHEPDFSMAIDYRTSDPVPQRYGKFVTDMIFARYLAPTPKYRVAIRHRAAVKIDN